MPLKFCARKDGWRHIYVNALAPASCLLTPLTLIFVSQESTHTPINTCSSRPVVNLPLAFTHMLFPSNNEVVKTMMIIKSRMWQKETVKQPLLLISFVCLKLFALISVWFLKCLRVERGPSLIFFPSRKAHRKVHTDRACSDRTEWIPRWILFVYQWGVQCCGAGALSSTRGHV